MSEQFTFTAPAKEKVKRRAHIGVVGSGDLEILLELPDREAAVVDVTTKVSGHRKTWEAVLHRFFERHNCAVHIEIRDYGATPGTVWLRLEQAIELAQREQDTP